MTLTIVGGWYEELCGEPHWQEIYGPGGRAAAALSGRKTSIRLLTYCPADLKQKLEYFAKTFGFTVDTFGTASAVTRFDYLHWLRPPIVSPGSASPAELPPICVEASDYVLRYGFYEGDAIVKARRAVYDPQNAPEKVQTFHANGSTAEELLIVCNFAEGSKLTGHTQPEKILDALLRIPNVIGAALKGGWAGVFAATKTGRELIKPPPTQHVHKIGSGDVFSAEAAYGWMALGLDPIEASRRASVQVACYTNSGSLPIEESGAVPPPSIPPIPKRDGKKKKYDIYVAGPFFNYAQLAVVEEMNRLFSDAGLVVFSPYHHVGLGESSKIAEQDLHALHACRVVIANLEGYDPGTVFEVGYARAIGIPVLVYSPNLADLHSTMFTGSGCEIARDFTTAVYRAAWWAKST